MAIITTNPKVLFKDNPKEINKWERWFDFVGGDYDIWFDGIVCIWGDKESTKYQNGKDRENFIIPKELKERLEKIENDLKNTPFEEPGYYVKHAQICFIYKDQAYKIGPQTFNLYKYIGWSDDTFFERNSSKIINVLENDLGIKYYNYNDFID